MVLFFFNSGMTAYVTASVAVPFVNVTVLIKYGMILLVTVSAKQE